MITLKHIFLETIKIFNNENFLAVVDFQPVTSTFNVTSEIFDNVINKFAVFIVRKSTFSKLLLK